MSGRELDLVRLGIIDVPRYRIPSWRGDFTALVSEGLFYRVQGLLSDRVPITGPKKRNRPDFPLRGFVRCEACGRPLTGSWAKGRHGGLYPYDHCRSGPCRAVNVSKTTLEGLFVELERLQPTASYMAVVKDAILRVWRRRQAVVQRELAAAAEQAKAIRAKLDRRDEAFLFKGSIDQGTYERHRDRLREELTLAKIARHATEVDELDVEGILASAERGYHERPTCGRRPR